MLVILRHADVAKLESNLVGERKGHAIALEGLEAQLQKAFVENSRLEQQLKDQQRIGLQKQKEVDDLRQAAIESENQLKGCGEVMDCLQKTLLGISCSILCTFLL
jgi:hypothetical protein